MKGFVSPAVFAWLARLWPAPQSIDRRERWRIVIGAALGLLLTAWVCQALAGGGPAGTWLIAPLGASAVLVFGVPASPLAQPWAVVGGNTVSALAGIACASLIPDVALASAVAVALALVLMLALRCLHPPGGASALLMVLMGITSLSFALFPVLFNSLLLVAAGMLYNSRTGRAYPHAQGLVPAGAPPLGRVSDADLDAVLARYNQVLPLSRDDLQALLSQAEAAVYQRSLGALRCADVMTPQPVAVQFGTPLLDAWDLMRERGIKALPVTDRARRIAGIVTQADFMRLADLDRHEGLRERMRSLLRASGISHTDRPEVVGQVMTRKVRVARATQPLAELLALFSEGGHHHIPIIDDEQRLVGILTQTDLVRALSQAVRSTA